MHVRDAQSALRVSAVLTVTPDMATVIAPDAPTVQAAGGEDNWVQCDRCGKWRRVGASVVDSLDDNANWFCEDNPDPLHSSCTHPQELTNEEIDQGREEEDTLEKERRRRQRRPAVWQLVRCARRARALRLAFRTSAGTPGGALLCLRRRRARPSACAVVSKALFAGLR